jgi:gas vesicle protein
MRNLFRKNLIKECINKAMSTSYNMYSDRDAWCKENRCINKARAWIMARSEMKERIKEIQEKKYNTTHEDLALAVEFRRKKWAQFMDEINRSMSVLQQHNPMVA